MITAPLDLDAIRSPGERGAFVALLIASFLMLGLLALSLVGLLYLALIVFVLWLGKILALAEVRGQGIRVTAEQYPRIYSYVRSFAARLGLKHEPEVYVLQATLMNAFAAKAIRRRYVVLYSDLVDAALESGDYDEVAMIVGHEMTHHVAGHVRWSGFLRLGLWLPFLYFYWSRRAEYTCDRAGVLLVNRLTPSVRGMVKLAVGRKLGASTNLVALRGQMERVAHEIGPKVVEALTSHPLTIKRIVALEDFARAQTLA